MRPLRDGQRRVLMTEELFRELGATSVDWGEPDTDGFYTPTIRRVYVARGRGEPIVLVEDQERPLITIEPPDEPPWGAY